MFSLSARERLYLSYQAENGFQQIVAKRTAKKFMKRKASNIITDKLLLNFGGKSVGVNLLFHMATFHTSHNQDGIMNQDNRALKDVLKKLHK